MTTSQAPTRVDEAANLSEPKIQMDEAANLSEPKTRQETNRANAQHSTGPKTPEGKANSSRNSFKHGLYSRQLTNNPEEAAQLDALKAELRAEHQPANITEEILVNELAEQFWRIRRARQLEMIILKSDGILPHIAAIQRMMSSAERGFHKALTTLRQLQKDRTSAGGADDLVVCESVGARHASPELTPESCPPTASPGVHSTSASAPGVHSTSASAPGFVPQFSQNPAPGVRSTSALADS